MFFPKDRESLELGFESRRARFYTIIHHVSLITLLSFSYIFHYQIKPTGTVL